MQKITEIRETYQVKRRTAAGSNHSVYKTFTRYREVRYVEGRARFGHYLLDYLFILIFNTLVGLAIGLLIGITGIENPFEENTFDFSFRITNWLIVTPAYYFLFECAMQSSPGKAILGRIVVDEYGNKPTTKQIFIRSISRAVPFEPLSCLSTLGWHDTWSATFVLQKKDLYELKLLQKVNEIDNTSVSSPPET